MRRAPRGGRGWPPRVTGRVMSDLRIWMLCFGLLIGLIFPYVLVALGVPATLALRPGFFAATTAAGLLVAEVNHSVARAVVGARLRRLAGALRRVEGALAAATSGGDWTACDPQSCQVTVDSADELGQVADSFNRLVDELARSHRVAADVRGVSEALATHLDLDGLATAALQQLANRIGCAGAALLCVYNGRVLLAGSLGISTPTGLTEAEAVRRAVNTGEAVSVDLPEDTVITATVVEARPRLVQVLPLCAGVRVVGVLVVSWLAPPGPESSAVLQASLAGLGVALNNALSHEDLQRVAGLDPLTGVYNRRFGLQRLDEEFSRSARSGDPLGVLMMDLDYFKSVNDTYGHLVGDRVLQAVIWSARGVLREGDILVRYGGEEFLIVLPGAGCADIATTAERVRRAISEANIVEGGQRIKVTVSIGGAGLPHPQSESPADLLTLADRAVYSAKTYGRDRCVIA